MASQTCHNLCVCVYVMSIRMFQDGQHGDSQSVRHGECGMSRQIASTWERNWKRGSRSGSPRSGFTLVELLVSISVMGILAAMLLPAVQSSREAARGVQCKNNLKQLTLAAINYEARCGCFPKHGEYHGVCRELLSDLGDQPLSDAFVPYEVPLVNGQGSAPPFPSPTYLTCPSLIQRMSGWNGKLASYFGNIGWRYPDPQQGFHEWNGVITYSPNPNALAGIDKSFVHVRAADVSDGLSNTGMFSERKLDDQNHYDMGPQGWNLRYVPYDKADYCQKITQLYILQNSLFESWDGNVMYSHLLPPNHHSCFQVDTAGSNHPGGCHFSLCDGSTRFVSQSIDRGVWRALGTRASGDTIGEF